MRKKKCSHCDGLLLSKGLRKRTIVSLLGRGKLSRRKYCCQNCKSVYYPLDSQIKLSDSSFSKRLIKSFALICVHVPFEHAKNLIKEFIDLEVSEFCLKRIIFTVGKKLSADAQKPMTLEEMTKLFEKEDTEIENMNTLYVQGDGSMVPTRGKNTREFKENKLAVAYWSNDIHKTISKKGKERTEIKNKKFVSSIGKGVEPFKNALKNTTSRMGAAFAKTIVFLSDGAPWLINMQRELFPGAIRILDWYHAVDHLWTAAFSLFGKNNHAECSTWIEPFKALLWQGKVKETLAMIRDCAYSTKKDPSELWQLYSYFFTNRHAMKYQKFRDSGFHIGSGVIESANKYIVANRLKLSGMRWTIDHADAIIWLRCKYFENYWEQFWNDLDLREYLNQPKVA